MKQGTEYAKRVKRLLGQLLKRFGKIEAVEPVDPIEQLIIGILAGCTTHAKAQAVYKRLRSHVVDLNELRVTPAMELADQIGDGVPLAKEKAQRIVDALNAVRKRQDSLDLSFLKQRGRREAREYLEALDGVNRAAAASVVLFSLGGHAVPVDDLLLYILRKEELVDPKADNGEVQAFLERCVNAAQAQSCYEALSRYAAGKTIKIPLERLASVLRPEAEAARKMPAVSVVATPVPGAAGQKTALAGKQSAAAGTAKPAGKQPPAPAKAAPATAKNNAAKAHTPPKEVPKVENRKPKAPEPRPGLSAPKPGGNHNNASARAAAVRKKK